MLAMRVKRPLVGSSIRWISSIDNGGIGSGSGSGDRNAEMKSVIDALWRNKESSLEPSLGDTTNSPQTLPRYDLLKTKEEIMREVLSQRENRASKPYDGLLVQYKKARNVFSFFKEGIMNVWRVHRELGKSIYNGQRYLIDYYTRTGNGNGNGKGNGKYVVRRRDYRQIVEDVAVRVQLMRTEYTNGSRTLAKLLDSDETEIKLSRREFVELGRDASNWRKLPIFGLLFLILEEMSLPLLYVFPGMIPSTCVLPGRLEKRYLAHRNASLKKLTAIRGTNIEEAAKYVQQVAMGTVSAYSVPGGEITYVGGVLGCGTSIGEVAFHVRRLSAYDFFLLRARDVLSGPEAVHGLRERGFVEALSGSGKLADAEAQELLRKWLSARFVK